MRSMAAPAAAPVSSSTVVPLYFNSLASFAAFSASACSSSSLASRSSSFSFVRSFKLACGTEVAATRLCKDMTEVESTAGFSDTIFSSRATSLLASWNDCGSSGFLRAFCVASRAVAAVDWAWLSLKTAPWCRSAAALAIFLPPGSPRSMPAPVQFEGAYPVSRGRRRYCCKMSAREVSVSSRTVCEASGTRWSWHDLMREASRRDSAKDGKRRSRILAIHSVSA
mmetsp:Transcript_20479/g.28372  ORF Transcript_20479/g.28372 Transcript_20479/m.28372 type:complete len:225 (-) Transcript_20479:449-1123(-)